MKIITYTIVLVTILLFLIGCKAKTVFVPVESVKTEYRDRLERDSIYVHDSTVITKAGDTITIFKYKYIYKDRVVKDTVNTTDSIAVPYPVVEIREVNVLNLFQKIQIWISRIFILLLVGYGLKFVFPTLSKYIKF